MDSNNYVVLSQIVDTLKLHFYHGDETTSRHLIDYNNVISLLSDKKDEAYAIKNANNEMRFVNHQFGADKFRVMATTVKGFSISLENQDVSISLKSVSQKSQKDYPENYNFDLPIQTQKQPVVRVEFRASFLARVGHKNAIDYILRLVNREFFPSSMIKVSEIHLATDVQGYNFHELDRQRFRTRKSTTKLHEERHETDSFYFRGKKFTGFSYGSGDDMIRIYNKSVEISKNPDKAFIKMFSWEKNPNYNPDKEVWRIEVQYRRAKLKTMYDDTNGLLDGFENVISAIPSLWRRALDSFTMIDLSDELSLEHFLGYTRNSEGFKELLLTDTVRHRIHRANTHPLWHSIASWNFSIGETVKILLAPVTGSFQWVSNSIKSFLSTLLKYQGDLSPKIIEDAFLRADEETRLDKNLSLVDNAVNNTLDYLGASIKHFYFTGENSIVERDTFSTLQKNLSAYVREVTNNLFDMSFENEQSKHYHYQNSRAKILNKSLKRIA